MGIPIQEEHVFTCAMATARFLARQLPNGTAFVIGESGLMNALHSNGYSIVDSHADYVVVGEGRTLSYEIVEKATGVKAYSVGKPGPVMMRAAHKELGLEAVDTIMIGDTMDTDILGGVQLGYRTVLVLSGSTTREDLKDFAYRPDLVVDSIADLLHSSHSIQDAFDNLLADATLLAG